MKKIIYALLIVTMGLCLVSCGRTEKQIETETTGVDMKAPEGATDVNYSYKSEEQISELTYVYEGADWVYRIQPTESLMDISGMNYDWISVTPGKVSDMEAEYKGYSEQAEDSEYIDDMFFVQVVNWYDDAAGVTHSLSASGKNIDGMDIGVYAENLYSAH